MTNFNGGAEEGEHAPKRGWPPRSASAVSHHGASFAPLFAQWPHRNRLVRAMLAVGVATIGRRFVPPVQQPVCEGGQSEMGRERPRSLAACLTRGPFAGSLTPPVPDPPCPEKCVRTARFQSDCARAAYIPRAPCTRLGPHDIADISA